MFIVAQSGWTCLQEVKLTSHDASLFNALAGQRWSLWHFAQVKQWHFCTYLSSHVTAFQFSGFQLNVKYHENSPIHCNLWIFSLSSACLSIIRSCDAKSVYLGAVAHRIGFARVEWTVKKLKSLDGERAQCISAAAERHRPTAAERYRVPYRLGKRESHTNAFVDRRVSGRERSSAAER